MSIRTGKGFTLMELLLAVALVGIMVAIVIPAYQNHQVRARISEAVATAGAVRDAVAEHRITHGNFPEGALAAGIHNQLESDHVTGMEIRSGGVIVMTFGNLGHDEVDGTTIRFTPSHQDHQVTWDCIGGSMPQAYRPARCRR